MVNIALIILNWLIDNLMTIEFKLSNYQADKIIDEIEKKKGNK